MRLWRNDIDSRQEAKDILLADGWNEDGAEAILDAIEADKILVDSNRLLQISTDYKDR